MQRSFLKLAHCRSGNFAVMFALMLPFFAAIIAFIADQANIAMLQSRIATARDAALVAAAQEYVGGQSGSPAQLEPYAKSFFLANLGEEYAHATTVKLITPESNASHSMNLEVHVKYEPLLSPVYTALSGKPGRAFAIDLD